MIGTLIAFALQSRLPFVDEGPKDPDLVAYRANLLRALKNKDVKGIKARIADDIVFSVGDPDAKGEKALFKQFEKTNGAYEDFCQELETVLKLGGHFTQSGFWAPYTYQGWPEDVDAFEYAYAVVPKARIYSRMGGDVIATVENYAQVKVYDGPFSGEMAPGWRLVYAPGTTTMGYARNSEIRTNADYRGLFEKRKGGYQLAFFAAGD